MTPLLLNFGVGVWSGWGVVGMNLLGQLIEDPDFEVIPALDMASGHFMSMDPLHYQVIERAMKRTRDWEYTDECVWIDSIGNDLKGFKEGPKNLIGRVIVEKPDLQGVDGLKPYKALLTGSQWCADLIEDMTGRKAKVIHEGIDPAIFCPTQKTGWLGNTFNIYSCGKVEYRKGQDVVLMAFKQFSEKHEDARLITIWNSPFCDLANGYKGITGEPLWLKDNGFLDVKRWAKDNGIDPDKVLELGCVPNWTIPHVLREMDVMLAPSRVESCTSLPVMEAMACGVPVIAGYHTGMKDLLTDRNSLRLTKQTAISGSNEYFFPRSDCDWYESDPEEIQEHLEWVYNNREAAIDKAHLASRWIRTNRTWSQHALELKAWLKSVIDQA